MLKQVSKKLSALSGSLAIAAAVAAVLLGVHIALPPGVAAEISIMRVGGPITIGAGQVVRGDVVAVGGSIHVDGQVEGDVVAMGGAVTVTGTVTQDVTVIGGSATLAATAQVGGDVTVIGGTLERHPDASIGGQTTQWERGKEFLFLFSRHLSWPWWSLGVHILYLLGLFAFAVLVKAVFPREVASVAASMERDAGRSMVIGLLAVLLLPPLTLLLVLTIIGPFLLWLLFLAAKLMGYVAAISLVGRKVAGYRTATGEGRAPGSASADAGEPAALVQLAVGFAIVAILRHIPFFGVIFTSVLTIWSVGAVLDTKFGTNRPWLPPRVAP